MDRTPLQPFWHFFFSCLFARLVLGGLLALVVVRSHAASTTLSYDASGNTVSQQVATPGLPVITGQPLARLSEANGNAGFSVNVTSDSPVTYQWKFNGAVIPGATGDSLYLPTVAAAQEGSYTVVVTNATGSVVSSPGRLALDVSGNGLPDSWEQLYFGNLNQLPGADYDGDGVSNLDEYLNGTNPAGREAQLISFGSLPIKTVGDPDFVLTATASSGLPVSFQSSNPAVATVLGSTVTIAGAGNTTITASQAGNGTYFGAPNVAQTLTVNAGSGGLPVAASIPAVPWWGLIVLAMLLVVAARRALVVQQHNYRYPIVWMVAAIQLILGAVAFGQGTVSGVHTIDEGWAGSGFGGAVTRYERVISETYPDSFSYSNNTVTASYDGGTDWASTSDDVLAVIGPGGGGYHGASARTTATISNTLTFSTTQTTNITLILDVSLVTSDNQNGVTGDQESSAYSSITARLHNENGVQVGPAYTLTRSKGIYGYDRYSSYGSYDSLDNSQRTSETGNGTLNRIVLLVPPNHRVSYTLSASSFVENRTGNSPARRTASAYGRAIVVTGVLPLPPPADDTGEDDDTPKQCKPAMGMAAYDFHTKLASLKIIDTPVGYNPPYGPGVPITVTYTQRSTSQPATFDYTHFGPKWNMNWVSYVVDDPTVATAASGLARAGGGKVSAEYFGSDNTFYHFQLLGKPKMVLRKEKATALPYEIVNADGSKEIYGQSDGSAVAPRRVFLTQRVDPAGNAATLTYDASMRITKITDALGQETTLSYDFAGDPLKVTKVTDPFGRFATFDYDGAGRLSRITDVIGIQSSFTYEGATDFINSMTTPYGTTTFTNTENGSIRRVTATDPAGDTEVIESNSGGTATLAATDPVSSIPASMTVSNSQLNQRNSFYWDKKQWKEAPNDYTKAHIYHWLKNPDLTTMSGYLESEKPPLQSRIWYNYPDQTDPQVIGLSTTPSKIGRVIEGGTQLFNRSITSRGKIASETDPVGRTTNYQYADDGIDLVKVSQAASSSQETWATYVFNAQHRPVTFTDANNGNTTYTWNPQGQLTSTTNAKSETTTYSYFSANALGKQRKGRIEKIDGALAGNADVVSFDYDNTGNVSRVTGPDGYVIQFAYDSMDRLVRVTFPDATFTETTYLALDPRTWRDRMGRLTTFTYNSIRQLHSVTDPLNRTIGYRWCKCGDLSQIIDAMGRITKWKHDVAGRISSKEYTNGSKISYVYEPLSGRLSSITDEKGQIKSRGYNLDDTVASLTYANVQNPTANVAFTYDTSYRRLTRMVDGVGTTNFTYKSVGSAFMGSSVNFLGAGLIATVDGPLSNDTIDYRYDELGRRTRYRINSVGETRTFDPIGRLLSVVNPLGTFGYTYHGATGRVDTITYPTGLTAAYTYHPLVQDFRLKDITHTLPGPSLLSRHSYEYNAVGNITRWTQIAPASGLNRSWSIGYDDADQLTSVASQDPVTLALQSTGQYAYTYDPAGNRLTETIDGVTTTAVHNALNQLVSLSKSDGSSGLPAQTYEWDAENRLLAVNYSGTAKRSEFTYDGLGRRHQSIERDGAAITAQTSFLWKGMRLGEERDTTNNTVTARYLSHGVMSSRSNVPAAPKISGLYALYSAEDHLGSIRQLVTSTNALSSATAYDPWGRLSVLGAGQGETNAGYTGHWFHAPTETHWPYFRQYNAATSRWLSRDPHRKSETASPNLNLYSYANTQPINFLDPDGREAINCNTKNEPGLNLSNRRISAYLEAERLANYTKDKNHLENNAAADRCLDQDQKVLGQIQAPMQISQDLPPASASGKELGEFALEQILETIFTK